MQIVSTKLIVILQLHTVTANISISGEELGLGIFNIICELIIATPIKYPGEFTFINMKRMFLQ